MRFVVRIDPKQILPCAALCAALTLSALPGGVQGQEAVQAGSATLAVNADSGIQPPFTFASLESGTPASSDATVDTSAERSPLAGYALTTPSATQADVASMNDISLDDQVLSRQRGGAVGMLMVAATPQLMSGNNNVTLWDEIAPPSPMPIPVDAARGAQGNVAMYQRK